jgi:hypothetical protein
MQRTHLSPEDQKLVARWRLYNIVFYSLFALVAVVLAWQPGTDTGSSAARTTSRGVAQIANID